MARLTTYLNDNSISGEDRLVGSNYLGVDNYQTNNFKIKDLTEYIQGQISISPSNSTLKANGGIVNELINGTNSLAVDLSATNITGQLANSDLANSSITINGTAVSLGGTITIGEVTEVTAGTYLSGGGTEGAVTLNHDATTRTNTTSTAAPAYGATFTVIDALTTNATGHVTGANTKTVTVPASDDTTYTIEAVDSTNDSIIRLVGTDSTTDDVKLIAGSNITLSTSEANDTITIASQAFGTVFTVATESAMIAATTTGGDIVIRTDVSKTFIHNGGSAGTAADFSELQFSGINTLALTAGDGIDLSRTTVTNTNNDVTVTNTLATASERGGVKIGYTTDATNRNYAIQLDSEKMYVNVPWTDANDNTFRTIEVDTDGNDSANETLDATETLRFKKGANVTLAESAGVLTISSANTEYNVVDSSAAGLAPQLPDAHGGKFLKADGTYEVPAYIANTDNQLTTEQVQDIVGGMFSSNTETRISATYDDDDGIIDLVVDDMTANDNTQNTTELSFVAEDDGATPPAATGNIILRNTITGASSSTDDIKLNAGSNITLTRTDEHNITIAETTTYTHPTHPGDDIDIDTEELTDATVISDFDFNITTDTSGHVTDANATIATRDLTLADLGYTGTTDANTYSLPTATASALGGVKVGTNLSISSGSLSADSQTANDFTDDLKTKLDGIEASATADQTAAEIRTALGTGNEGVIPAAGSAGEFLKHDGTFGTPSYTTNTNTQNTAAQIRNKVGTGNNGVIPAAGTAGHFLKHDGTFGLPSYTTNTNTEYTAGNGLSLSGTVFTANINYLSYSGSNNFMKSGADDRGTTVPDAGEILYLGTGNDEIISRARVDDLPFNNITNNNQIANGAGYTTNTGTTTADNTQTFTNKSGNISQWTNDANYFSSAGGTFTGDIIISDADPDLILNDSTSSSTSTTYTPSILFKANDVTKAIIGKTANNTSVFYAGYNYDGPVGIKASEIHSGHTHNPEYIFGYEPSNNGNTWGLQMKGDTNTSNSLYMDPDANNHNSSIFFGGYTNALNVTRISHNQTLGLLLLDVPDAGTSNLSVKFRQYNIGGYMQNMIDFEDDGDIRNVNGSYGTIISDRRAKENIVDATSKLDDILSLKVKNFNLIGSNKKQIGLIAQDVEKVFPSWVDTRDNRIYKTHDEHGVPLETKGELVSGFEDGKSLKVGMEFAVFVKTIQELNEKILNLQERIQTLENK